MRIRYVERNSVEKVLAWLAQQNAGCSREAYQKFLRRLLCHLSDAQALEMGVELTLLHAIRRRLGLPLKARQLRRMTYVRGHRPGSSAVPPHVALTAPDPAEKPPGG